MDTIPAEISAVHEQINLDKNAGEPSTKILNAAIATLEAADQPYLQTEINLLKLMRDDKNYRKQFDKRF